MHRSCKIELQLKAMAVDVFWMSSRSDGIEVLRLRCQKSELDRYPHIISLGIAEHHTWHSEGQPTSFALFHEDLYRRDRSLLCTCQPSVARALSLDGVYLVLVLIVMIVEATVLPSARSRATAWRTEDSQDLGPRSLGPVVETRSFELCMQRRDVLDSSQEECK